MLLHAADQVLVLLHALCTKEILKVSEFGQRYVAVLTAAGVAIGRLDAGRGVLRPDDLAIASSRVAGKRPCPRAARVIRCTVSPWALEAVGPGDAVDPRIGFSLRAS
jgi:hypothetical protein